MMNQIWFFFLDFAKMPRGLAGAHSWEQRAPLLYSHIAYGYEPVQPFMVSVHGVKQQLLVSFRDVSNLKHSSERWIPAPKYVRNALHLRHIAKCRESQVAGFNNLALSETQANLPLSSKVCFRSPNFPLTSQLLSGSSYLSKETKQKLNFTISHMYTNHWYRLRCCLHTRPVRPFMVSVHAQRQQTKSEYRTHLCGVCRFLVCVCVCVCVWA